MLVITRGYPRLAMNFSTVKIRLCLSTLAPIQTVRGHGIAFGFSTWPPYYLFFNLYIDHILIILTIYGLYMDYTVYMVMFFYVFTAGVVLFGEMSGRSKTHCFHDAQSPVSMHQKIRRDYPCEGAMASLVKRKALFN